MDNIYANLIVRTACECGYTDNIEMFKEECPYCGKKTKE